MHQLPLYYTRLGSKNGGGNPCRIIHIHFIIVVFPRSRIFLVQIVYKRIETNTIATILYFHVYNDNNNLSHTLRIFK